MPTLSYQTPDDFRTEHVSARAGAIRKLLGNGHAPAWRLFAEQNGAEFVPGLLGVGRPRIRAMVAGQPVLIELYNDQHGRSNVPRTRLRATVVMRGGHRLTIRRSNILDRVAGWFGFQGIPCGDPGFDRTFIVRGEPPERVRSLIADAGLRTAIASGGPWNRIGTERQWVVRLMLGRDSGLRAPADATEKTMSLDVVTRGIVRSRDELQDLFNMMTALLLKLTADGWVR